MLNHLVIICIPTHITVTVHWYENIACVKKKADFKCRGLKLGLKVEHKDFAVHNIFSKGAFEPRKVAK